MNVPWTFPTVRSKALLRSGSNVPNLSPFLTVSEHLKTTFKQKRSKKSSCFTRSTVRNFRKITFTIRSRSRFKIERITVKYKQFLKLIKIFAYFLLWWRFRADFGRTCDCIWFCCFVELSSLDEPILNSTRFSLGILFSSLLLLLIGIVFVFTVKTGLSLFRVEIRIWSFSTWSLFSASWFFKP